MTILAKKLLFKAWLFIIFIPAVLILMSSCSDTPTVVGFDLVYDTLDIYPMTSSDAPLIASASSYYDQEPMLNIPYFMLGSAAKLDDKFVSAVFLRFKSFTTIIGTNYDSLKVITGPEKIKQVRLVLYPAPYAIGDTAGSQQFAFSVHRIKKIWDNETRFIDFFPNENVNQSDDIESSNFSSFSGVLDYKDSALKPISLEFNNPAAGELIYEWIVKQKRIQKIYDEGGTIDTANIPDSLAYWGLALIPDVNTGLIRQFYGTSNSDTSKIAHLMIVYERENGQLDSFKLKTALEGTFLNSREPEINSIVIQGVRTIRGEMKFDLSVIPKFSSIHKAQLELTLNKEKSYFGTKLPDTVLYAVTYTEGRTGYVETENYASRVEGTDKFLFTNFVQPCELWANRKGTGTINFIARGTTVYLKPDRFVFYGLNESDTTLRPRLRLIYSKKPRFAKGDSD